MIRLIITIAVGVFFAISGCHNDSTEDDGQVVVRVNGYEIKSSDLESLFKFEGKNSNFHFSNGTKADFVKQLVKTQLLIQEAKKRKLDQREGFRQTIQRYWESTLIRDLIAEQAKHIRETTTVSREEVEEYYRKNKVLFQDRPLEELRASLSKSLEDQKVSAELRRWTEKLESDADIEIIDVNLRVKNKTE